MVKGLHAALGIVLAVCVTSASGLRSGWVSMGRASADEEVTVRLALVGNREGMATLEATFWNVSNPDHPDYGHFLDAQSIAALVSPGEAALDAVVSWSKASGARSVEVGVTEDYVTLKATASRVEAMFGVTLEAFVPGKILSAVHSGSLPVHVLENHGRVVRAAEDYFEVDASIQQYVRTVHRLVDFPPVDLYERAMASHKHRLGLTEPGIDITPKVIWSQYKGPTPATTPPAGASQGCAEFEQAYFYQTDLNSFQRDYGLVERNVTIVGPNKPNSGYLGECSLDMEYICIYGGDVWMFSLGEFDMVAWAQKVLQTKDAPKVQSVSWGSGESGYEKSQMTDANTEFMKMGAAGFSILIASGDVGTGSTGFFSCGKFDPTFPASSPYVTAVGGTSLSAVGGTEMGWSDSGGGFSTVFERPSYQDTAVASYMKTASLPSSSYFTSTGRGIPDVSAVATNFQVIIENSQGPLSGTSAATPTFAALIAVINGERHANGKAPLGFLNPALYKVGSSGIGTDITAGNNKVSACPAGFPAISGWDAITGFGTPSYPSLRESLA